MIDPKTFYTEKITSFSAQVSRLQKQLTRQQDLTHNYTQVWIL